MTEPQLRALFKEMAESAPINSRADPALARRRGRVRLRWRRACAAGTSVVAAAAAGAMTLAVGLSPFQPAAGSAAAQPAAPRQFNPLVPYASFGWLPAGESMAVGSTGKTVMSLTAQSPSKHLADWDVSLFAAGVCKLAAKRLTCSPYGSVPIETISGRAPAVHGRPAFWSGSGLVWQYASGGWGRMIFPYPFDLPRMPKATRATIKAAATRLPVRQEAIKIASTLKVGVNTQPVVFPVQFTDVPSQWQMAGALYVPDGPVLRAQDYTLNGAPSAGLEGFDASLTFQENLPSVVVDLAHTHPGDCFGYPKHNGLGYTTSRETINGYHVIVNYQNSHTAAIAGFPSRPLRKQWICTRNGGGLAVQLSEAGLHPAIGIVSLFKDHLRLLGTNPANWTPKPIV